MHVEGVADHDPVETEVVAQHRHPRRTHRRRCSVDRRHGDMGGEDAPNPGVDRRGEGSDVTAQERVAIDIDHREGDV